MRQRGLILMGLLLTVLFSFPVFADTEIETDNAIEKYSTFIPLSETDDFDEIKALESEILERTQTLYTVGKLKEKMEPSDIDYDKAVKIYMNGAESVFNDSMADPNEFCAFLDQAEYIWVLQIPLGDQSVTYTFNIGMPVREEIKYLLTPEDIAEMESEVGHWKLVKAAWGNEKAENYKDYIKRGMAQGGLAEESPVVVIGGTPVIRQPLAIAYEQGGVKVIPVNETANRRMKSLLERTGMQTVTDNAVEVCDLKDYLEALEKTGVE